ncbi:MAG: AMP-binding protein [Paludibacteraceae bacterium]|nr:AMP-binding protein [Paludibacteraceae bacterium]
MANPTVHMFTYINKSFKTGWNNPGFSDFGEDVNYTYGEIATQIARLNLFFELAGVQKAEKIAFCGGNSSNWGISFLSVLAYGAVAVSILPDFIGTDVEKLVNHSDSQILLVSPAVAAKINFANMPNLKAIISIKDFSILHAQTQEYENAYSNLDKLFAQRYPNGYTAADVHYQDDNLDDLALINYTSGTTSSPKGVMLTYRSLSSNCQFGIEWIPNKPSDNVVSMLPLAHMFGMMFEFIYQVAGGTHVYFITRLTTPVLMKAFHDCQPYLILTVPLVLEKIYQKKIKPMVSKPAIRILWHVPVLGNIIKRKVREGLMTAFGGKLQSLIIGGAALNSEVEKCLKDIQFPFLVGYGMTECGPLISYSPWQSFVAHSCGRIVDRMELKIDSKDPLHEVGEIMVKGEANMIGYYKNEEATKQVLEADGWLHTGDLGLVDEMGNIFIKGRNKNMILGPSGQNIYPEEIEDKVNALDFVLESLIVERDGKLVALVVPDAEAMKAPEFTDKSFDHLMTEALLVINKELPNYSQIKSFEVREEEFEKTPKRSIRRFLYK